MGPLPQTPSSPFLIMIPSIPQKGSYWNPDAEEPYYEEGPNYYGQPGNFFTLAQIVRLPHRLHISVHYISLCEFF